MLDITCDTHDTPTSVLSAYPCFVLFSVGLGRVEQKPSCWTHMKLVFQLFLQNSGGGGVFTVALFCLFFQSFFFFFTEKTIELAEKTAEKCCCEHPYLWWDLQEMWSQMLWLGGTNCLLMSSDFNTYPSLSIISWLHCSQLISTLLSETQFQEYAQISLNMQNYTIKWPGYQKFPPTKTMQYTILHSPPSHASVTNQEAHMGTVLCTTKLIGHPLRSWGSRFAGWCKSIVERPVMVLMRMDVDIITGIINSSQLLECPWSRRIVRL